MKKPGPHLFELLEERQRKIFFEHFTKSPSLFNWDSEFIPDEIRCETCGGNKQVLAYGKPCVTCNGTGIPPVPSYELFGPKRLSKTKK